MSHPTQSLLTLCNACDANTANPNDPGGYCDECLAEVDDEIATYWSKELNCFVTIPE